jgi:hypothetical protein
MCLTADTTPDTAFAVVKADGEWAVGRMIFGSSRIIARGKSDDLGIIPGVPARMALECALTEEGDRMAFWIDGQLIADVTSTQQHGPYASVGAYADAAVPGSAIRFDDAVVLTGDPTVLTGLGADTLVLEDPFDDTSIWSTGRTSQGRVAYGKGALRLVLRKPGSISTWLTLAEATPVLRTEGKLALVKGRGSSGFLCGMSGDDTAFYYASLDTAGEVAIGFSIPEVTTELLRVPLPPEIPPAKSQRLAVECAVTGPDADRVTVWVDGVLVADHFTVGSLGSFGSAAIFAESQSRRFEASMDDVAISTGAAYDPTSSPPGAE